MMGPMLAFLSICMLAGDVPPWAVAAVVGVAAIGYFLGAWLDEVVG